MSFSVNSHCGWVPSLAGAAAHSIGPRVSWLHATLPSPASHRRGRAARASSPAPQLQLLRNHSVGSRWMVAAAAERLATVRRMQMSSGPALAYSTVRSAKRFSSKAPVSSSSYSALPRPRARFSARNCA